MQRIRTASALVGLATVASLVLASCWMAPDGDSARSGYDPAETTLNTGTIGGLFAQWSVQLGQQPSGSPPISQVSQPVSDGSAVYVATGNPSNTLVAVDPATGATKWTTPINNPGGIGMVRPTLDDSQLVIVQPGTNGKASVQRFNPSTGARLGTESIPAPGGSSVEVAADQGHEAITVFGAAGIDVRYGTVGTDPAAPVFTHAARVAAPLANQVPTVRSAATVLGPRAYALVPEPSQIMPNLFAAVGVALDASCTTSAPCAPLWTHFTSQGPVAVGSRLVAVDSNTLTIVSANDEFSAMPPTDFVTDFLVVDSATGKIKQGATFTQDGHFSAYTQPATDGTLIDLPRFGRVEMYNAVDCVQGRGECFPEATLAGGSQTSYGQTMITTDLVFAAGNGFIDVFARACPTHTTCAPLLRVGVGDKLESMAVPGDGRLYVATDSFLEAWGVD